MAAKSSPKNAELLYHVYNFSGESTQIVLAEDVFTQIKKKLNQIASISGSGL